MSTARDEQREPEVNPDDENAELGSDGSGEVDLDPDDDSEADYEPQLDPQRKREVEPPEHCSGCHR